jgi:polyhydroxybutyrate depolymerase
MHAIRAAQARRHLEVEGQRAHVHLEGGNPVKKIAVRRLLRFLRFCLWALLGIVALGGALFGYYIYTPVPEVPRLSGTLTNDSIEVGGLKRTYTTYVPRGLAKGAPLVVVMHGSGENGAQMRIETGYGFERLADQHRFAVVYPNAHGDDWNACGTVGDVSANGRDIDDVGFLTGLVDKLATDIGTDPARVFAAGSSRGGFMAFRLALEVPSRFRAVAAVSANVHTPDNFKCKPAQGGASVMIMNGTEDPLVPFDGGQVSLLGFSYKYGRVMSSRESGQYFADLNHIAGTPETQQTLLADGVRVDNVLWRNDSKVEVELVAVHGGGHGIPQPYRRHPRLLGPSPREPNGPEVIWQFFERQRR